MSESLNILLGQAFTHMAGNEDDAKAIVENYRKTYEIKKSSVQRKEKKGSEYWIVKVEVTFQTEKNAFDETFGD